MGELLYNPRIWKASSFLTKIQNIDTIHEKFDNPTLWKSKTQGKNYKQNQKVNKKLHEEEIGNPYHKERVISLSRS